MTRSLSVVLAAFLCSEGVLARGAVHVRLAAVDNQLKESPENPSLLLQRTGLFHEHGDHGKALEDLRAVGPPPFLPLSNLHNNVLRDTPQKANS